MNLPNKLSCARIALIPVFIFFYLATFIPCNYLIAMGIFIIAAVTDFLDGFIARKYNLVTDLGKLLDPIADKLLVMSALILMISVYVNGTPAIPNPYGIIAVVLILGREFIVSAFRQVAAAKGFVMAADKWGKVKMVVQVIALPIVMIYTQVLYSNWFAGIGLEILKYSCYSLIGVATLLTVISGLNYIIKNKSLFKTDSSDKK